MSEVMKGTGLAHVLAEALSNSKAQFGQNKSWSDQYVNRLTTVHGKKELLGPLLDVVRGDAAIVPRKRIIDNFSVKPGDRDVGGNSEGVVVLNRQRFGNKRVQRYLTLGEFQIGVASWSMNDSYKAIEPDNRRTMPNGYIDVPIDPKMHTISKRCLLPKYLIGKQLPGIALRDFYLKNPHHLPECFFGITLFWGTVCKNSWCYYIPGIEAAGPGRVCAQNMRICDYTIVDGRDVLSDFDHNSSLIYRYDAAVFV